LEFALVLALARELALELALELVIMDISVELTLTPLQDSYEEAVINFIKKLRASGLTVLENPLSTQVYGEYDTVMTLLKTEIMEAFEAIDRGLLYMKIVKSDRSGYEPDF
jgi:uncharacterized protein YqgV (UPF0045/DUF77 family)